MHAPTSKSPQPGSTEARSHGRSGGPGGGGAGHGEEGGNGSADEDDCDTGSGMQMSRREVENELYGNDDDGRKTSIIAKSGKSAQIIAAREKAKRERAKLLKLKKVVHAISATHKMQTTTAVGGAAAGAAARESEVPEHENPMHRGTREGATRQEKAASLAHITHSPSVRQQAAGTLFDLDQAPGADRHL